MVRYHIGTILLIIVAWYHIMILVEKVSLKGGLSGWMTWRFLNDLEIFSTSKRKLFNFQFRSIFIFNKRAPKLSICHLPTKGSVWVFDVTNRTNGFSNFQSYHKVVTYLFNSLAKSCTLFRKYSYTINRNNIFELTYYK